MSRLNWRAVTVASLYGLVLAPLLRAYGLPNELVFLAPIVLVMCSFLFTYFRSEHSRVSLGKYTLLSFLFVTQLCMYLFASDDERAFLNALQYFIPIVYFIAIVVVFDANSVNRDLAKLFRVVFIIESIVILMEAADGIVGFDVHTTVRLFIWYLETDNRFDEINLGSNDVDLSAFFDALPPVLGLYGFPHYTAPLYVVSFVFAVAHAFSRSPIAGRTPANSWSAPMVLVVGLYCIYMLGVKTHFVTTTLALLILGMVLSGRILLYFGAFLAVAVPATLLIDEARERFENLLYQVTVGNEVEGSRIDVIFRFQEYLALLDLSPTELLAGTGGFGSLAFFERNGLFLEQKILVYALVFGVPYVLIIVGFFFAGLLDAGRVFKKSSDSVTRSTAIAVAVGLLVYLLEMGHFGFTFSAPNSALWFVMVGMASILATDLKVRRTRLAYV